MNHGDRGHAPHVQAAISDFARNGVAQLRGMEQFLKVQSIADWSKPTR